MSIRQTARIEYVSGPLVGGYVEYIVSTNLLCVNAIGLEPRMNSHAL